MEARLDYAAVAPGAMKAMKGLQAYINTTDLEHSLLELVKLRASQINGCAYCVNLHAHDARTHGETEQRIYSLSVWREAPFYTDRERAALEWTEALTLLAETHVPDAVFEAVRPHFSDKDLADLTLAVVLINGWNRFGVSFRDLPEQYEPISQTAAAGV
jgi:AhpD family alkylhydroperoxidase